MKRPLKYFGFLALMAGLLGCPMAKPGSTEANPTGELAPKTASPSAPASSGMAEEVSGAPGSEASPKPDGTSSQPVAMPSGVFSSGTTPECAIVLDLKAKPLCFYPDSGKQVEFSGRVHLECAERSMGHFDSPTIRIINKDSEFLELSLFREDRSFLAKARTHQPSLALDSCFVNRDPIFSFLEPNLLDLLPCSGEECRGKCDGTFDRIEVEEINPRPVPAFTLPGESDSFRTVNVLPPCGTASSEAVLVDGKK